MQKKEKIALRLLALFLLLLSSPLVAFSSGHLLYLLQEGEMVRALELYEERRKERNAHDFPLLREMGERILKEGERRGEAERLLLTMYGAAICNFLEGFTLYEKGMKSDNPSLQLATIRFLSLIQEEGVERLLFTAFSSPHLAVRMEAAYALAQRKSPQLYGMLDSLMKRLPPPFHVYFPQLLVMLGSADAMGMLKQLSNHEELQVRLATILSAARSGRDDFLEEIRAMATHSHPVEQESAAIALGYLKDSHSLPLLRQLTHSPSLPVQLTAYYSLAQLGEPFPKTLPFKREALKDPLCISLLAEIPHSTPLLLSLVEDPQLEVRLNAALALLKKREPACLPPLLEVITDEKGLGFQPLYSPGRAFMGWQLLPYAKGRYPKGGEALPALALALKEQIVREALELPQALFLKLARVLFDKEVRPLIPLLIHLLENLHSEEAKTLLKEGSSRLGVPFIRTYCTLGLYRMGEGGVYKEQLYQWLRARQEREELEFHTLLSAFERIDKREEESSRFVLTPKESSRLLIEAYAAVAQRGEVEGIDLLLQEIRLGREKNRYPLAGLLLKSIQ